MNKRGSEELVWVVILVLLVLASALFLFYWINSNATGKLIRNQVDAKQVSMLIDSSMPNTLLIVKKPISLKGKTVTSKDENTLFEYSFFNPGKVSLEKGEGFVEIDIK